MTGAITEIEALLKHTYKSENIEDEIDSFNEIKFNISEKKLSERYYPLVEHITIHSKNNDEFEFELSQNHSTPQHIFDLHTEEDKADFDRIDKVKEKDRVFICSGYINNNYKTKLQERQIPDNNIFTKKKDALSHLANRTQDYFDSQSIKILSDLMEILHSNSIQWTWSNISSVFSPIIKDNIIHLVNIDKPCTYRINREEYTLNEESRIVVPQLNIKTFRKLEYLDERFLTNLESTVFKNESDEIKYFSRQLHSYFATMLCARDLIKNFQDQVLLDFHEIYGDFATNYLLTLLFENDVRKSEKLNSNYFEGKNIPPKLKTSIPTSVAYCRVTKPGKTKTKVTAITADKVNDSSSFEITFKTSFLKKMNLTEMNCCFKYIIKQSKDDYTTPSATVLPIQPSTFDNVYLRKQGLFLI